MKKIFWVVTVIIWGSLSAATLARAEWVNISQKLPELDIRFIVSDTKDSKVIFAASDKRIYRTRDTGSSWNQVLTFGPGNEHVRSLVADTGEPGRVYVCTDKAIYRSKNAGDSWDPFFTIAADGTQKVFCITHSLVNPEFFWIGTDRGLIRMNEKTRQTEKINGLPDTSVYSILLNSPKAPAKIVMTGKGVYRNLGETDSWERVFVDQAGAGEEDNSDSQQFDIEELSTLPVFSNLVFLPEKNQFIATTPHGVLQSVDNASTWRPLDGSLLPDKKINFITHSKKTFYVATDRGAFQWDERARHFHEIYLGLGSKEVHSLDYNAGGDYLLAATEKGVYRWQNPELNLSYPANKEIPSFETREIFSRFASEPTILQVRQAAIQYAEVSPQKIEDWRRAAARKAWAPTLSFHQNYSTSDNIDIDRGGTGDPDRFIRGPREKSQDQYATLSWDFGDLIWNNDQTSIDSRSKLMVELRNDILSEVTHLYYERRRLQTEIATTPAEDFKSQLERQIRLEELTSMIDGLTGGYLSKRLNEIQR